MSPVVDHSSSSAARAETIDSHTSSSSTHSNSSSSNSSSSIFVNEVEDSNQ